MLEIIDEEFSSYRLHTVPNRIVSTTRREKATNTRHRDANTRAAHGAAETGLSADEEYGVTTNAVATMVQPFNGTMNNITVGSAMEL